MTNFPETHFEASGLGVDVLNVRQCKACLKNVVTTVNHYHSRPTPEKLAWFERRGLVRLPQFTADELCDGDCCE
jgi:hypothetical protein